MGRRFNQRRTSNTIKLKTGQPGAYKLHLNKDFVVPMSRDKWTTDGLIFSVNMMEHDNSNAPILTGNTLKALDEFKMGYSATPKTYALG